MRRFSGRERVLDKISEWALYILIFVLPFSKSLIEISIVTALVSLVCKKLIKREPLLGRTPVDILLYVFLGATLLSFINTSYMSLSARAFFSKSLEYALIFLIAKEVIDTKEKFANFLIMASLSCSIILIDAFTQHFITHVDFLHNYPSFKYVPYTPSFPGSPTASFPYPNDFAAWILIFVFPTGLFACFPRKGRKACFGGNTLGLRLFSGMLCAGLIYSLYLAKVRGAWAAFLLAFGILSLFKLKKIGVIVLVLLLLVATFMHKSVVPYVLNLTSIMDRGTMWKNGWEIFKRHPIIGNGLNTFFAHYAEVRSDEYKGIRGSYAHNCFLQMAADIGLLGLFAFLFFVGGVIFSALRSLKDIKDPACYSLILGISAGLVAYLMHSFVDTSLYSLNLAVLFWLTAGILLAAVKLARS